MALLSRPVRARGLKLFMLFVMIYRWVVAPRAGAWIETFHCSGVIGSALVAPRAGAWIETCANKENSKCHMCRAPCGRVD